MYKAFDLWLPAYLTRRRSKRPSGTVDILFCIGDHFEPLHRADKATALQRMARWKHEYQKLIAPFSDADGSRPKHTFFYPIEQYDPDICPELAELCALCGGEVEVQLHHKDDTAETLRGKLERGKEDFLQHGFLARDGSGQVRYEFVHGNWALDNSHPLRKNCGVNNELEVLQQTGCYADFTMPSAPHPTQTRTINSIYYAKDTPAPKSHDFGTPAKELPASCRQNHEEELLLVQGPLGLNWRRREFGLLPSIENAEVTGINRDYRYQRRGGKPSSENPSIFSVHG